MKAFSKNLNSETPCTLDFNKRVKAIDCYCPFQVRHQAVSDYKQTKAHYEKTFVDLIQ